jgi:hypothetical protein
MKAQIHPSDALGWLIDRMDDPSPRNMCPKACARAKQALLNLRKQIDVAADRDRELCAYIEDLEGALRHVTAIIRSVEGEPLPTGEPSESIFLGRQQVADELREAIGGLSIVADLEDYR